MYATGMNCMDGAVQGAVRKDAKRRYRVKYVDKITQPGIVKVLAENSNLPRIELIKEMLEISIREHGSRNVTIAAHHDCAGNPVAKEVQFEQLARAREVVRGMIKDLNFDHLGIEITLLWVNGQYLPEEVHVRPDGSIYSHGCVIAEPVV